MPSHGRQARPENALASPRGAPNAFTPHVGGLFQSECLGAALCMPHSCAHGLIRHAQLYTSRRFRADFLNS
jgi:hypothetical protein